MADLPATDSPETHDRYLAGGKVFVQETKAKRSLVAFGSLLVALFLAGLVLTRAVGNTQQVVKSGSTTTTTSKAFVSDSVLTAILGTGVFILLVGLLYSRITAIKLPGGPEIDLSPGETQALQEKVKQTIDDPENDLRKQDLGSLMVEARHFALAKKLDTPTTLLSDDDLSKAVQEATEAYTAPPT